MPVDARRLKELFVAASELPPAERAAWLDRECDDAELRKRLEALLRAHDDSGGFLAQPATVDPAPVEADSPSSPAAHPAASEIPAEDVAVGSRIGPYKLLQKLGEGGMGAVWVAEQTEPVKRRVALKLIKAGMDSAQVLRRFEAERQALALMDHTNIAKVFDGGTVGQAFQPDGAPPRQAGKPDLHGGRPYFVMELVKGIPITKYCDELHLPIKERLELFMPVCAAIQHAHQKGIIHRDVKPSNVLVCIQDGKPVPKVIDFGVAKALHQRLTDESMFTEIGQIVGTLEYMSPEQAELSTLDIDTRADVYALGVLLYELLTGTTPHSRKRLKNAAFAEMLRIIREEEPQKPSTRLTESKGSLASLAAQRRTEPAKLTKAVRGELDWIVMRCLEKDRTRRYETASGLARDVERHLHDEPVEACPPSAGYRLGKLLRRHKGPVLAASLVLLALLVGIAGTSWGLVRAEKARRAEAEQRKIAEEQRGLAEERKRLAEANEKNALREKKIAEAVRNFLQRDLLRQADATEQADVLRQLGGGFEAQENPTIKELLNRAAAELTPGKIEGKFPGEKEVQASILRTVGETYRCIGEYGKAVEFLSRASDLYRDTFGADYPDTLFTLNNLACAYKEAGKLSQAIKLFEQVRDAFVKTLGAEHPETLVNLNDLAITYHAAEKLPQAIKLFEHVRDAQVKTLGADHPSTLSTLDNLAMAYHAAGKLPQAIKLSEQVRDARVKTLGADHPYTLNTLNNLAGAYQNSGKLPQAIKLLEQVRDGRVKTLGADHPNTLTTLNNLAAAYQAAGKREQALPLLRQAAEGIEKRKFMHQYAERIIGNLTASQEELKQYAEAETWRRKLVALVKERAGAQFPAYYAAQLSALGLNLLKQKKWTEAETVLREGLAIRKKTRPDGWNMFFIKSMLGEALAEQKKYADAEPLLLQGYQGMKKREAGIPEQVRTTFLGDALARLARLYEALGKKDEAAKWRKELDAGRKTEKK